MVPWKYLLADYWIFPIGICKNLLSGVTMLWQRFRCPLFNPFVLPTVEEKDHVLVQSNDLQYITNLKPFCICISLVFILVQGKEGKRDWIPARGPLHCNWQSSLTPLQPAQGPAEPVVKYQHLAGRTIKRGKYCLILHTFRCLSLTSHFVGIFEQTFWLSSFRVIQ